MRAPWVLASLIACQAAPDGLTEDPAPPICGYTYQRPTCLPCAAPEPFAPWAEGGVRVDDFGAAGDGDRWDHQAIQQAIEAAGEGGTLIFTGGKTYTVCQPLSPLSGQTWTRDGDAPATLRRCDPPAVTLTAGVLAGDTRLPVDHPERLEVGMWVSPVRAGAGTFFDGEGLMHHPVLEVFPDAIRVWNGLEQDYPAGAIVVPSFALVTVKGDDVTLEGLTFDGNRGGNDAFVSWGRHSSLAVGMDTERCHVHHNRFLDSQGDALTMQGHNAEVDHNLFEDLNGSAIHLSWSEDVGIHHNTLRRTNLKAASVQHAEGAITWSLNNKRMEVEDNCVEEVEVPAFADVMLHGGNDGVVLRRNAVCHTGGVLHVYNISTEPVATELIVEENRAIDAGDLIVAGVAPISGLSVEGNRVHNGAIALQRVEGAVVRGNTVEEVRVRDGGAPLIWLAGCPSALVEDNTLFGGRYGVAVSAWQGTASDWTQVRGNSALQQLNYALITGTEGYLDAEGSELTGVVADDNVLCSSVLGKRDTLVHLGRGSVLARSCVTSNAGGVALHGNPEPRDHGGSLVLSCTLQADGELFPLQRPYVHDLTLSGNTLSSPLREPLASGQDEDANRVAPDAGCDEAISASR
ncbi:MAG: right-handed parallel beta-helix repeat-containing protein [Deltaproteobacteria bacterium]|nr:right-handed parallel beta-helix repeat-containing protein [Deltaproteobacteria bacterium]